jgi:hypothetical protein
MLSTFRLLTIQKLKIQKIMLVTLSKVIDLKLELPTD